MKNWIFALVVVALVIFCPGSFPDERASFTGRVTDSEGKPIEHATVMVYHAGVKKGYSTYCPSCYADCGKRTTTDAKGMFTFKSLRGDLWFELLVALDGYEPAFVKKIDPSSGEPVTATLLRRGHVGDPSRVFRGHVEDSQGRALRDAVVQPVGLLLDSKTGSAIYGRIKGLDPMAVTNEKGDFEIAYSTVGLKILVSVEARGMAPVFSVVPAGVEHHTITMTVGSTVRGRLVKDGRPIPDAEVGLIGRGRGGFGANLQIVGYPYDELRVGTQQDGTFVITNVPSPVDWYVYAKMESVARRGATGVVECATKHDMETVNVGDVQVRPAYHLRGTVVLSDGKQIPDGMRVTISSETAWDNQTTVLHSDGRFEFNGLAAGDYSVFASVKGYSLPKTPVSVKRTKPDGSTESATSVPGVPPPFSIDRDVDDYVITLSPE
jgi:Carboxypeptidase regulatory-like domain